MIIDQIGQHEVLLLINHTYNKICDILGFFKIKTQEFLRVFSQQLKKGPPKSHEVRVNDGAYCPITLS